MSRQKQPETVQGRGRTGRQRGRRSPSRRAGRRHTPTPPAPARPRAPARGSALSTGGRRTRPPPRPAHQPPPEHTTRVHVRRTEVSQEPWRQHGAAGQRALYPRCRTISGSSRKLEATLRKSTACSSSPASTAALRAWERVRARRSKAEGFTPQKLCAWHVLATAVHGMRGDVSTRAPLVVGVWRQRGRARRLPAARWPRGVPAAEAAQQGLSPLPAPQGDGLRGAITSVLGPYM